MESNDLVDNMVRSFGMGFDILSPVVRRTKEGLDPLIQRTGERIARKILFGTPGRRRIAW